MKTMYNANSLYSPMKGARSTQVVTSASRLPNFGSRLQSRGVLVQLSLSKKANSTGRYGPIAMSRYLRCNLWIAAIHMSSRVKDYREKEHVFLGAAFLFVVEELTAQVQEHKL